MINFPLRQLFLICLSQYPNDFFGNCIAKIQTLSVKKCANVSPANSTISLEIGVVCHPIISEKGMFGLPRFPHFFVYEV